MYVMEGDTIWEYRWVIDSSKRKEKMLCKVNFDKKSITSYEVSELDSVTHACAKLHADGKSILNTDGKDKWTY